MSSLSKWDLQALVSIGIYDRCIAVLYTLIGRATKAVYMFDVLCQYTTLKELHVNSSKFSSGLEEV